MSARSTFNRETLINGLTGLAKNAWQEFSGQVYDEARSMLGVPGGVFRRSDGSWYMVASAPGSPPTNWHDEVIDGLGHNVDVEGMKTIFTFYSNVMVRDTGERQTAGTVINVAQEIEFGGFAVGHLWTGYALNDEGNAVRVAPPHYTEPRPYMQPLLVKSEAGLREAVQEAAA